MQDAIEEETGAIAGKGSAGAIRTMRTRSKAKDQKSRFGITESWYWFGPVVPVKIGAAFDASDLLAVIDEPGTASASGDLVVECSQVAYFLRRWRRGGHLDQVYMERVMGDREGKSLPLINTDANDFL